MFQEVSFFHEFTISPIGGASSLQLILRDPIIQIISDEE
jgi:hypothetical protein